MDIQCRQGVPEVGVWKTSPGSSEVMVRELTLPELGEGIETVEVSAATRVVAAYDHQIHDRILLWRIVARVESVGRDADDRVVVQHRQMVVFQVDHVFDAASALAWSGRMAL